jgi:two-component system response regulator DesR
MIRVLLAEDQAMVRGALAALLSRERDIEIVAEVARGDEVVGAALATQPDVALLDIEMPGGDGLAAAQALRKALPTCHSMILTTFGRSGYLRRAMESGAVGFLLKDAPASELVVALRRVMAGERVVDPDLALAALSEGSNPLTPREREVLSASLFGASLAEIAARLVLSEGTVRNHLSTAMQKLDAQNRMVVKDVCFLCAHRHGATGSDAHAEQTQVMPRQSSLCRLDHSGCLCLFWQSSRCSEGGAQERQQDPKLRSWKQSREEMTGEHKQAQRDIFTCFSYLKVPALPLKLQPMLYC